MSTEIFVSDTERWAAITMRDTQADGAFVYAITTTGVYCRPSCASRQPRREHVRFFADCAAAEQAGFRACKRCRPQLSGRPDEHTAAIARACRLI
jgi:AraC family transcriptional regulator of adaptative response/methylated-DNA-[protein]-cysteine methyltransferase